MIKVLVLFANNWDREEFSKKKYQHKYQFIFAGPNLLEFPYYFQLPFFSTRRFIDKMIRKIQNEKIDAVISSDEYIGAIISAAVAQQVGLPSSDPSKIIYLV